MNAKSRREIKERELEAWKFNAALCDDGENPCKWCGCPTSYDQEECLECWGEIQKNERELENYALLEKALWQAECERGD